MKLLLKKAISQADLLAAGRRARLVEPGGGAPSMFVRLSPGEPTPAQAEAGTYPKKTVRWQGLTIKIENPAGSVRYGHNWQTRMVYDYGYVARTEGVDGDEVDVYLGPAMDDAPMVYVVHQRKYGDWTNYDEDKVMLGFMCEDDARAAYLKHYDDERFLGPITAMPVAEFVAKVKATRGAPAMIKAQRLVLIKGHVGAYLRGGKLVNLSGYQGRAARAKPGDGQAELFERPSSSMKFGEHNPYRDKDPELDTPDLFTGRTKREDGDAGEKLDELIAEHKRLVHILRTPSHEDDEEEADRQSRELEGFERKRRAAHGIGRASEA